MGLNIEVFVIFQEEVQTAGFLSLCVEVIHITVIHLITFAHTYVILIHASTAGAILLAGSFVSLA